MRINLEKIQENPTGKSKLIVIGELTDDQLAAVNRSLATQGRPQAIAEVVFYGFHTYKSRILKDGYTIEDALDQIESAMEDTSVGLKNPHTTGIENPIRRFDRYGNEVQDRAIFECSDYHPRLQLYSVIPRFDKNKPKRERPPRIRWPCLGNLAKSSMGNNLVP